MPKFEPGDLIIINPLAYNNNSILIDKLLYTTGLIVKQKGLTFTIQWFNNKFNKIKITKSSIPYINKFYKHINT